MDKIKAFILKNKLKIFIAAGAVAAAAIIAVVAVNISSSNKKSEEPTASSETETQTEAKTTEPETESETEPTEPEPELPYINPLTGEKTATDYSNARPVAVMLNTIKESLPQSGNSKADILIEMAEEGGITRIIGIYQDITGVGNIGTVRSTREYFLAWARSFDAITVHAGGDSWVLDEIKSSGYVTIDCLRNARPAFWRDSERLKYLSIEHTLFTSSDNLQNWISTSDIPTWHMKTDNTVLHFTDEPDSNLMNAAACNVKVTFSGYKSTTFTYNKDTGKYDVYFWNNEPYMDEASGKQTEVTNILVLPVPNWTDVDSWGKGRQKYDLSGGRGYYISGGKFREINWTKGDYNQKAQYGAPLVLTDTDGGELKLATGKTYICVISNAFGISVTGE